MTTRALEELNGGLGSCQAGEDLSTLADPCLSRAVEDKAQGTSRLADLSSRPHDSPASESSVDAKPKKVEKEPVIKVAPSPGKEKLKAGATLRSAPARKKAQAAPPPQPPPLPPLYEELPWGDLSLNKCLVLVSLLALLGSAFQLCRDAVVGKVDVLAPAPEPWVPPSSAPKVPEPLRPKQAAAVTPPVLSEPQAEAERRPEAPGTREAAGEDKEEASKATEEATGEAQMDRAPKEKPSRRARRKEERARKEKEARPREDRQRREKEAKPRKERPRADRQPQGAPPRRRQAHEGGHRRWARDFGDAEWSKKPTWSSKRRGQTYSEEECPDRQKHCSGRGRD